MTASVLTARTWRIVILAFSVGVGVAAGGAWGELVGPPRVAAIELRLEGRLGRSVDLASALAFGPGDVLTERAVRRTLDNLHATGLIAEATVLTRPAEVPPAPRHQVVAVVVVRALVWVDRVRLEGRLGLPAREVRAVLLQKADAPVSDVAIADSQAALADRYRTEGYRRATIQVRRERQAGHRVTTVFAIDSGPRARVGDVRFVGETGPFAIADLEAKLKAVSGRPYDRRVIDRDLEVLRAWLANQGHAQARVEAPAEFYDPVEDRVSLTYPVAVGPRVNVVVEGAPLPKLRRRGLLPFLTRGAYDAAQLRFACGAIRGDYQRRGHYQAEVVCEEAASPESEASLTGGTNQVDVRIGIDPGPIFEVAAMRFVGNQVFDRETLARLMTTSVRRPLRRSRGRLVTAELEEDVSNIRSFYVLQGFAEPEVGPALIRVDSTASPATISVEIPIAEGRRRRVVGIQVDDGGVLVRDAATMEVPPLRAGGGPFHPLLLEESRNRLRSRYENAGYPDVVIAPTLDWDDEGTLVDIDLAIEPGVQARVDHVILRGAYRVRDKAIRRAIGLRAGEPISRRRLLEVERDLYRLGVFTRVDVSLGRGSSLDGRRDVIVQLEEGRPWRIGYGLGYHSVDEIGGLLSLSRVNPLRRGGRFQLDLRANRDDQRYRLIFDQPSIGAGGLGLTYTLFFQAEDRKVFTLTDRGVQVALRKQLGRTRFALVYDYRLVDQSGIAPELGQLDRQEQEVQISSLTPNLFVDRRDDPFEPTRGWTTYLQFEQAFPLGQADASFIKVFWQQTAFQPLGRWGTLAGSVRFGGIEPLDRTAVPDPLVPEGLASARVPITERFFAGGRTSHRAYERDRLGIPGLTLIDFSAPTSATPTFAEIGGNGLVIVNLDYRFPIAGSVGGTVFLDAGNVWADWRDVDPADAKLGVGLGIRYRSPIGPLRFELGWKVDPEPGQRNPVFLLSFGNPF